jgi:hypothetical protein
MLSRRTIVLLILLVGLVSLLPAGEITGKVVDPSGAAVPSAQVKLSGGTVKELATVSDPLGNFRFANLNSGVYQLTVTYTGFAQAVSSIQLNPGENTSRTVSLAISARQDAVAVEAEQNSGLATQSSLAGTVISGRDLESLPDDPDALEAAIRAMAGPAAGPDGSQIYVDGFLSSRLPPKETIQEIRVNQNAFAAENDRPGFGNIQIITKPGSNDIQGQAGVSANDQTLNARNPFAANKPPFRYEYYDGLLSGPIRKGKSSYTVVAQARQINENAIINATVLDPSFNRLRLSEAVVTPQAFWGLTARVDTLIGSKQMLSGRYQYDTSHADNSGLGGIMLPSQGYALNLMDHTGWLSDTITLSSNALLEIRSQFQQTTTARDPLTESPSVQVLGAFQGGGSPLGNTLNRTRTFELQDYLSVVHHRHTMRMGVRLYATGLLDESPTNFFGTYTFAGGQSPDGGILTSLDVYQLTLQLQAQGLTPAQIRAEGGGASALSISAGNPRSSVSQFEGAAFFQDEFQLRPSFTLGYGARYENQTNIRSPFNVSPRASFAWAPHLNPKSAPNLVIRGGFGIFYTRFPPSLTLQAQRYNGTTQLSYLISDPSVLNYFPNAPPLSALVPFTANQMIREVDSGLTAPYLMQGAISTERHLSKNLTASATYIASRGVHMLRSVDIHGCPSLCAAERIFDYQSSGTLKQQQVFLTSQYKVGDRLSLFFNYVYGHSDSDTDGANTFPANPTDLRADFGRSALDIRHRAIMAGTITLPYKVTLSPFLIFQTGLPFDITTGTDPSGDQLFTQRPSFAPPGAPDAVDTRFGNFLLNPGPGVPMIPRNYGQSPSMFSTNFRLVKTISLSSASGRLEHHPTLSVGLFVQNLLNSTNPGPPVGNLSSPLFGQSLGSNPGNFSIGASRTTAGSRRIELQLRFNF